MRYVYLDGALLHTPTDVYRQVRMRLGVPAHCGENLDALHDVLTEPRGEAVCLVVMRTPAARAQLGAYGERLMRMLADSARESATLTVQFL